MLTLAPRWRIASNGAAATQAATWGQSTRAAATTGERAACCRGNSCRGEDASQRVRCPRRPLRDVPERHQTAEHPDVGGAPVGTETHRRVVVVVEEPGSRELTPARLSGPEIDDRQV